MVAIVLVVVAGTGTAVGLTAASGRSSRPTTSAAYAYYEQTVARYEPTSGGSMMGGTVSSMMGPSGYGWMMGGSSAPGWMEDGALPGSMMGSSSTTGQAMGRLFAAAPGPRVSASQAAMLGRQTPMGTSVDRSADRISFDAAAVHVAVLARPSTFLVDGLVDPAIVVPLGSRVTIELVETDPAAAHGLVVTALTSTTPAMPMMSSRPAFAGAAIWFLGEPNAAGDHTGTLTFTATTAGTYTYLCPVPGEAQAGMAGLLTVAG